MSDDERTEREVERFLADQEAKAFDRDSEEDAKVDAHRRRHKDERDDDV